MMRKLLYQGSQDATYKEARDLINQYWKLKPLEWFSHFTEVVRTFSEMFDASWEVSFESIKNVRKLKQDISAIKDQDDTDFYILRLVNRIIMIMVFNFGLQAIADEENPYTGDE